MATVTRSREQFLTVAQFAVLVGISKSAAYRLVEDGAVRVTNVARKGASRPSLRISPAAVRQFEEDRELRVPPRQRRSP
jgi:hypothetical protein